MRAMTTKAITVRGALARGSGVSTALNICVSVRSSVCLSISKSGQASSSFFPSLPWTPPPLTYAHTNKLSFVCLSLSLSLPPSLPPSLPRKAGPNSRTQRPVNTNPHARLLRAYVFKYISSLVIINYTNPRTLQLRSCLLGKVLSKSLSRRPAAGSDPVVVRVGRRLEALARKALSAVPLSVMVHPRACLACWRECGLPPRLQVVARCVRACPRVRGAGKPEPFAERERVGADAAGDQLLLRHGGAHESAHCHALQHLRGDQAKRRHTAKHKKIKEHAKPTD